MSNQIAGGIDNFQNLSLNARPASYVDHTRPNEQPHLSPFPKLINPPPNVPPSDDDLEATLENAREVVLSSNDPEMQLAWAADALVYVGVCADNEERLAAAKPHHARSATPRVEHQLRVDALNIVSFLAEQHHPKAEFLKGMWLEWGRFGQREDKKEAFRCYSRAADKGYARAEYRIGMLYESYNDPIKALRHYHRGVEANDAASCYRLGMMTLRGQHGQQQDYAKAIDLIRRSASTADENAAQGAYVYGMLLARQLPQIEVPDSYLKYDEREARMNIEKAAYLKFAKAQLKMGSAYELAAFGCDFNPALSMHYNALASKQGESEADMALSKWFLVGSDGLFPKNEELAFVYAERAAQSGLATAEFALGYFNEIGVYTPVSIDKALEWYQKASDHGNEDAAGRIEGLRKQQVLSRRDHENVAVSRIRSQFGSMKGVRPDRFRQQQAPRLEQIPDSPSSVYSVAITPVQPVAPPVAAYATNSGLHAPARGTTPYPVSPTTTVARPLRPASVTPYPLENGPPNVHGLSAGYLQAQQPPPRPATTLGAPGSEMRPSSAFQLNPQQGQRPLSAVPQPYNQGQMLDPRMQYGDPQALGQRPRPATVQPYDANGRPLGNRIVSGPASLPSYQGYPLQQQRPLSHSPRPPMQPTMSNPQYPAPAQSYQQAQPPRVDIGFSAPFDDRRRQYGPSRPAQGGQPSVPANSRRQSLDHPAAAARPPRGESLQPPALSAVQPATAKTTAPKPSSTKSVKTSKPAPTATTTVAPSKPKPTNVATSSGPPPSKTTRPGRGPKTFDEMGVPATKEDNCVSLYRTSFVTQS